jgi:hypothetical protein
VHEHYAADGTTRTGVTVVTREPRVTEDDRALIFGLETHESGTCPCGCGQPLEEARDPKRAFEIATWKCGAQRAIELTKAKDAEQAKKTNRPDGWDAGLHYYVAKSWQIDEKNRG